MTDVPEATGDWRDLRAAVDSVVPGFSDKPEAERKAIWTIAEGIAKAFPPLFARCVGCGGQFPVRQMFRCTDCGSWMCPSHWRAHFGPNHRPHQ